jgi:3-hydroxybutyryl-CoA dehydrogenase
MDVKKVLVVGAGAMGRQIAMLCALSGRDVALVDVDAGMLTAAEKELRSRMGRNVDKGRLSQEEMEAAFGRMRMTTSLEESAGDADFLIEAIVEKVDVKRELLSKVDKLLPPHAIIATNSSTIVSSRLADATSRPDRVCNMHFFNPALVMKCVEVLGNPETSEETIETTVALTRSIGKSPVLLRQEISGFVANRLLAGIQDEAVSLYEKGIASVSDIDTAAREALGHPMGPFELMDMTGIDVNFYVRTARYEESGDEAQKPKRAVVEKFERGEFGRKTGVGWYRYDDAGKKLGPAD